MDTTRFSEGQYVTSELVELSPTKIGVIIEEAKEKQTDYGEALSVTINMDEKKKTWRLNRDSVKNMQQLGKDSLSWIGKKVQFQVVNVKGKKLVIGSPIPG